MCENCLMLEVHPEWIEPVAEVWRMHATLFMDNPDEFHLNLMQFRVTRVVAYLPPDIKAILDPSMYDDRSS